MNKQALEAGYLAGMSKYVQPPVDVKSITQALPNNALAISSVNHGKPGFISDIPVNPAPNSLIINDHGRVNNGEFKFGPSDGLYGLPDIAKSLGPKTNDICELSSSSCNRLGKLNPTLLKKYFPNLNTVKITPPYRAGSYLPGSITNQAGEEAYYNQSNQAKTTPLNRLKTLLGDPRYTPVAPQNIYKLENNNWVNKGTNYNFGNKRYE